MLPGLNFALPFLGKAGGGLLSKIFGKNKLDPTALLLGGLSMFGGDDGGVKMGSYREPGSISDPVQALWQALSSTYRLGQGLTERGPVRLRSSVVPEGPAPVQIPGLPFQIGGGMGKDPALSDPSILEQDLSALFKYDPFQSVAQQQFGGSRGQSGTGQPQRARRRGGV